MSFKRKSVWFVWLVVALWQLPPLSAPEDESEAHSPATTVRMLPVGQGNAILIRHGDEAIMLDAGSCASTRMATEHEKKKQLQRQLQEDAENAHEHQHTFKCNSEQTKTPISFVEGASPTPSHMSEGYIEDASKRSRDIHGQGLKKRKIGADQKRPSKPYSLDYERELLRKEHTATLKEDLHKTLPKRNGTPYLRTLLITHPDTDHYNQVPTFFPAGEVIIDHIMLSGYAHQYDEDFHKWLDKTVDKAQAQGRHVVFTNKEAAKQHAISPTAETMLAVDAQDHALTASQAETQKTAAHASHKPSSDSPLTYCFLGTQRGDGGLIDHQCMPVSKMLYTPAFSAGLNQSKGVIAQAVMDALTFNTDADKKLEPEFQILSMNAAHATENGITRRASTDTNTNSTVLRLSVGGENSKNAFIFGADATEATWEHIRAAYEGKPDEVQAKCLVLSHHGSRQHGATNSAILNLIQPEVCFLSAGMHGGFKHPRADVVDLVRNLESMRTTTPHAISCFYEEDRTHKRMIKRTGRAIFSTFDHGLCEVNMGNGDEQDIEVQTALSMGKVYVYQPADAGAQEFVLNLNRMWHIETPACAQQAEAAQAPPLTPELKTLIAETFGCGPADLIFWQKEGAQHIVPHPTHTMPSAVPEEQDPNSTEETPATTTAESQAAPSEAPAGKGKKRKRENDKAEANLDIQEITSPSYFRPRRNLLIKHGESNEIVFALLDPVVRQSLHS